MSLRDELFFDSHPASYRETQARINFNEARNYAISLIEIHDGLTGGGAGRPAGQLEALKRSALIFTVTAWESFVEETAKEQLENMLGAVSSPGADPRVLKVFNSAANEWLGEPNTKKPTPPDVATWTGIEWKRKIISSLDTYLSTFHSPSTDNVEDLFKRYLGLPSFKSNWRWRGVNAALAKTKLDGLIKLRGEAVHVGKRRVPSAGAAPGSMQRRTVVSALNLIYSLASATERALGVEPSLVPVAPAPP